MVSSSPDTTALRILIVEDEDFMCQGLQVALQKFQNHLVIVGEADNATHAIKRAEQYQPDVVILDLRLPKSPGYSTLPTHEHGITAIREIRRVTVDTRILVHSGMDVISNPGIVFDAMRAGAHGYVAKIDRYKAENLWDTIQRLNREPIYSPTIAKLMLQYMQKTDGPSGNRLTQLTKREYQVLELVADGKTNKEIAHALVIGENTVKTHVSHILDKLHLEGRDEVKWALRYPSTGY